MNYVDIFSRDPLTVGFAREYHDEIKKIYQEHYDFFEKVLADKSSSHVEESPESFAAVLKLWMDERESNEKWAGVAMGLQGPLVLCLALSDALTDLDTLYSMPAIADLLGIPDAGTLDDVTAAVEDQEIALTYSVQTVTIILEAIESFLEDTAAMSVWEDQFGGVIEMGKMLTTGSRVAKIRIEDIKGRSLNEVLEEAKKEQNWDGKERGE